MATTERQKTLEEVAPLLGHAYTEWKDWLARKDGYKADFFILADEAIEQRGWALQLVEMPGSTPEAARERVERHYAAWLVDEQRPHRTQKNVYEFVLSENPSFMAYSYVHEGVKYARTVSKGAVMIDDEWLKEEVPELYERVTYELPWGERISVPVEHLDEGVLGQLSRYIYSAKPQVKLAAPRAVREEEE